MYVHASSLLLESRVSDSSMCPLLPNTPAIPLQRINNKLMVEDKRTMNVDKCQNGLLPFNMKVILLQY